MNDGRVHFQVDWYRPKAQGGDTRQPLCQTPSIGWAGPKAARLTMSREAADVDCGKCQRELEAGGPSARRARIARWARGGRA